MAREGEPQLIADLQRAENLPGARGPVAVTSTHGSLVFLTQDAAFKVKRSRDYGFFDYSTTARRHHFCAEEVRLNRRAAPAVYLGVLPVYHDAGGYSLTRRAEVVDWAVHMRRLPDDRSALARLRAKTLTRADLVAIARCAAALHAEAPLLPPRRHELRESIAENFRQLEPWRGRYLTDELFAELVELHRDWLAAQHVRLQQRGCRDGHGDLRLEHAYLLDDGPALIDCIEFAERFRVADPALDAAFMAMDLAWRGRRDLAEAFVADFAAASDDYEAYPLIDGYMSYRSVVRAKVACVVAEDAATAPSVVRRKAAEAGALFQFARLCLVPATAPPVLVTVSTVPDALAPRLAVPVLSADAAGVDRCRNVLVARRSVVVSGRPDAATLARLDDVVAHTGAERRSFAVPAIDALQGLGLLLRL